MGVNKSHACGKDRNDSQSIAFRVATWRILRLRRSTRSDTRSGVGAVSAPGSTIRSSRVPDVEPHLPRYEDLPRRWPWRLVSPIGSRWLGDLTVDPLRIWTTQTEAAYRVLAETGVLHGDHTLVDEDFKPAYSYVQQDADRSLTSSPSWTALALREKDACRGSS